MFTLISLEKANFYFEIYIFSKNKHDFPTNMWEVRLIKIQKRIKMQQFFH